MKPTRKARKRERREAARHGRTIETHRAMQARKANTGRGVARREQGEAR
jgi:hypothetical protein